jgi:hypothetical protein
MTPTEKEVFKDIPGYEGLYQASNFGNVMSLNYKRTGIAKLLTPIISNKYYIIKISNVKSKTYKVHQLVAMAFLGHKPCGYKLVVNHVDHNKLNNHVDNLEIVTTRQNNSWLKKQGTSKYTGVYWNKENKKYMAKISIQGTDRYLGYFEDEKEAGKAYQKELLSLT